MKIFPSQAPGGNIVSKLRLIETHKFQQSDEKTGGKIAYVFAKEANQDYAGTKWLQ
jgi:hypothetical protein